MQYIGISKQVLSEVIGICRKFSVLVFIVYASAVFEAAADSIEPYIKAGLVHESNLFLLTDDNEAQQLLNSSDRSDTRLEISPGVRGTIDYSRQNIFYDLSLLRKEYDEFDTLNFTGGEARLIWNWLYGQKWSGQANYRFTNKQNNFNERLTERGDSSKINRLSLSAIRLLSPRYSLLSGIAYKSNDYKRRDVLSKDDKEVELGARYTSSAENTVDLVYQFVDSEYPDRGADELNRGLDDGFEDHSLLTRIKWQATGKSLFDIEAGFTDRQQDNISDNDFDGLIGTAKYEWAITGKTKLISSIWRDLRDSEDQLTNFVKVDGIGLELNWQSTAKITTIAKLEFENRDFQPNSRDNTARTKEDEYFIASLGMDYLLRKNVIITAEYAYEERESTLDNREFDNDIINLFVEFGF